MFLEKGATGRFVAFIATIVASAFPFTFAPELLVVTGGEMQNPVSSKNGLYSPVLKLF